MYTTILNSRRLFLFIQVLCLASATAYAQDITFSGNIHNPAGTPLSEVTVVLQGTNQSMFALTDATGNYTFTAPAGDDYTIKPYYEANPLNGVTTYDIVLIMRHISGMELLNNPYRIIAADADHNGVLDLADSLLLRNLITGLLPEFPEGSSWRFVEAAYVFPDPLDPFNPPYPETIGLTNVSTSQTGLDFVGVKIGDVNNTALVFPGGDKIAGFVLWDNNLNCTAEAGETPLGGWTVGFHGNLGDFYTVSNNYGFYVIKLPDDVYDVVLQSPNNLWSICTDTVEGVALDPQQTVSVDFAAQPAMLCPRMSVGLSTPLLRRCMDNIYFVKYCNLGTDTALNAQVTVALDTFLSATASSIPWSTVDGNTYAFDVGDVPPGTCQSFSMAVYLSCDAVTGQTHCSTAAVTPDGFCGLTDPGWDGSNLEITGECVNGEVVFTITNTGADMLEPVGYVIIEDIMIQMVGTTLQLESGESQTITMPANGSTWLVEVEQPAFHPAQNAISAAVEACGQNPSGTFSLGIITQFPFNNGGFSDRDCRQNVASYDPNDKAGYPAGVSAVHWVPLGTEIEYEIRFQNTGTDTAFQVVVRDTLSEWLDPLSIRPGVSSHPYRFEMNGTGYLKFLFDNILLADSNANEPASHGFVHFAVRPRAQAANGTAIFNRAAIYFDYNLPVFTNTTLHTLGEQYLDISQISFLPGLDLRVYPNPAWETAHFTFRNASLANGIFHLYDKSGRELPYLTFSGSTVELNAASLAPGFYFFRITDGAKVLASGKLVVVRP